MYLKFTNGFSETFVMISGEHKSRYNSLVYAAAN